MKPNRARRRQMKKDARKQGLDLDMKVEPTLQRLRDEALEKPEQGAQADVAGCSYIVTVYDTDGRRVWDFAVGTLPYGRQPSAKDWQNIALAATAVGMPANRLAMACSAAESQRQTGFQATWLDKDAIPDEPS